MGLSREPHLCQIKAEQKTMRKDKEGDRWKKKKEDSE